MDYAAQDATLTDGTGTKDKGVKPLADDVLQRCVRIVANVNRFKQPRLQRVQLYRDLYAGKVRKKYRQPFNVVLPVFSGLMDTIQASLNDDLAVKLTEQEPADYIAVHKLDALFQMEINSVAPNAKFFLKTRQDRSNALFSGRGFMANYAISDPDYRNCFEVFELEDALFQPTGGGHWPTHLYAGRQDITRSKDDLNTSMYDKSQVAELLKVAGGHDYDPTFDGGEEAKAALAKFKAMGLSPEANTYLGEQRFKLVEMRIVVGGTPYYIVFSPWYQKWVRFDKFSNVASSSLDPWVSWATHEDNKNFISKSFADDIYGVADATHTLFNQELLNREKSNYSARGYDVEMFKDVTKLDQAQTRPDALVPVTVPAGKRIEDGIFSFETAQLQGTINLIDWIQSNTGQNVGVTDLAMGASQGVSKRATVVLAEQQALAKRFLLRSSSYTEAMGEVAKLFVQGCKDHMPAKVALKFLGIEGEGWEPVIRRTDLDLYADVDVKITSSAIEMQNNTLKKEARMKVLGAIGVDPLLAPTINSRWRAEELLRSGGEYEDAEIKVALDTNNYGDKEETARAHEAIQAVQHNQKPEMFYGATTRFMKIIHDFAVNNRNTLGNRKFTILMKYQMAHAQITKENMLSAAPQAAAAAQPNPPAPGAQPANPANPAQPAAPSPAAVVNQAAAPMLQ
ncbi:MAG TPA: hypothetical protein VGG11_13820 [Xanthobacteraceae bacterium]|jgi:hypothetical protein